MQQRFTLQLISDLSADAAIEVWDLSSHWISEEHLLRTGIRKELHQKAVEHISAYAAQQLAYFPAKIIIHPQFAEDFWPLAKNGIDTSLAPTIDIFFLEYCALLRSGSIRQMVVTPTVITYFDYFSEALRNSRVECLEIPKQFSAESGIIKILILTTLNLKRIISEDILSAILEGLGARAAADLSCPEHYEVTDAYSFMSYVRLARWYQETALPVRIFIKDSERADERRFVQEKLQGRSQITNKDVDWILEQWHTSRKRRQDASNCPKCGQYDPNGSHYYRYIAGQGQFSCQERSRQDGGTKKNRVEAQSPVSATNLEELESYPRESLVSEDGEW